MKPLEVSRPGGDYLVAVFPNGGSAAANMGRALCSRFPAALEIYEEARKTCGVRMETLWRTDYDPKAPDPALDIAATFVNCAAVNAIRRQMGRQLRAPDLMFGSSLGLLAAFEAAGACSPTQGLKFLMEGEKRFYAPLKRSLFYGTVNIADISREELTRLIGDDLELSIDCCQRYCSLIYHPFHDPNFDEYSSHTKVVEALRGRIQEALGRRVLVAVHFPERRRLLLHTSLCRSLERGIGDFAMEIGLIQPTIPVMSESTLPKHGVGPYLISSKADVVNELARLVSSPSHFSPCIRALVRAARCKFVEIGPCSSAERTTVGLIRQIVPRANCVAVDTFQPQVIEQALLKAFQSSEPMAS